MVHARNLLPEAGDQHVHQPNANSVTPTFLARGIHVATRSSVPDVRPDGISHGQPRIRTGNCWPTSSIPSESEIHQTLAKYASQHLDGSVRYDVQAAAADNVDSRIVEIGDLVNRLEQESVTSPDQAQPNDLNPTNYGPWCGKNNSGPGDPIDELDRTCMGHDHCLNIGRPTCDCDREFVNRLRQIRGQFSGWARTYLEAAIIAVPRWHGCRV